MYNLNELAESAHVIASKHGWHETKLSKWHYQALIITEIGEAIQADRSNKIFDPSVYGRLENLKQALFNDYSLIKGTVQDELADVFIRTLDFFYEFDIYISDDDFVFFYHNRFNLVEPLSFTDRMWQLNLTLVNAPDNEFLASIPKLAQIPLDVFMVYVEAKMNYNKSRSYKHGNKKY